MSLRAIKKRDQLQTPTTSATTSRSSLFRKSPQQRKFPTADGTNSHGEVTSTVIAASNFGPHASANSPAGRGQLLLGRRCHSNPDLCCSSSANHERLHQTCVVRTKSETDLQALLKSYADRSLNSPTRNLIQAKSEVCLQTISTHNCIDTTATTTATPTLTQLPQQPATLLASARPSSTQQKMISGARSHRDLSQSAYGGSLYDSAAGDPLAASLRRRMSECSMQSSSVGYSQRTSAMSGSALTLASAGAPVDPNTILRVPIIGYEVMEERARFTVYKLRVENPHTNDCWLVLRRYTDFVRLNTKLKQLYPYVTLLLPRKKIFGDNFNAVFLDNRVQGLQMFVNSVMANEELRKCKLVREFFCLDEPPTYSESMEECRAIFEAQEETITHLKMQISSKNDLILSLQQKLRDEMQEKELLKEALKSKSPTCDQCSSSRPAI